MKHAADPRPSINQKLVRSWRLPDFRNLGVVFRLLVLVHLCAVATVLIQSAAAGELYERSLLLAARLELPLFLIVLLLFLLQSWLARRRYALAVGLVCTMAGLLTLAAERLAGSPPYATATAVLWALAVCGLSFMYFDYRAQRLSPSLAEARLQALTVRMRPHFLFNSLNAVLGVIRSDPRRAESALEEMSDVFRAVMQENRELIPLADEVALTERYLGLERLRLGERLVVCWQIDSIPGDALIPPLMLQPLVENAVYHGIEPLAEPGTVLIAGEQHGGELVIEVSNPRPPAGASHSGNNMAMSNIRERLMLFYDLEASLSTEVDEVRYRVRIRLPYRRKPA